ncbi:hypothetical protein [Burkholderia cenocepacia]|uniref:Uncharacterized protein n=1 Tax=Burkholderia cenocepacia TaxID=95486 RepID=A0A3S9NJQ2_9BURK|nr:hypothetical protein [Burkholderia cenocepacia]AZQ55989.1 hypothetical protein D5R55_34905 [Burkholderia cenocepacia]
MNNSVQVISNELDAIVSALSAVSEHRSLNVTFGNFGIAGVDHEELWNRAKELSDRIKSAAPDDIPQELEARLGKFTGRLEYLRTATIPQMFNANGPTAIPAFLLTLDMLERALSPVISVSHHDEAALVQDVRTLRNTVRALASRAEAVSPTIEQLQSMADSILRAYAAADRLPADLQELEESRLKVQEIAALAAEDGTGIRNLFGQSHRSATALDSREKDAERIIQKCETALRASTAVGLAGAFHDRAESLRASITPWVLALVAALSAGAVVGGWQLHQLAESIQASTPPTIVWTRLIVSILSVGGPVWFAWLSTKQIGQRFRLSEDYAYKASISKAYEGYRREAVDLDEDFQKRLFSTALTRLDEQPLRFVESETHGSPWHEFFSSDVVKDAIRIAPELVAQWKQTAVETVAAAKKRRKSPQQPANDEPSQDDRAA